MRLMDCCNVVSSRAFKLMKYCPWQVRVTLWFFACSLMIGALSWLTLIERTNSSSIESRPSVLMWAMPLRVSRLGVLRGMPAVPKRRRGMVVIGVCVIAFLYLSFGVNIFKVERYFWFRR